MAGSFAPPPPESTWLLLPCSIFIRVRSDEVLMPCLDWGGAILTSQPWWNSKASMWPYGWWIIFRPTNSFPQTKRRKHFSTLSLISIANILTSCNHWLQFRPFQKRFPRGCFPYHYKLNFFESRINRYLLSTTSFSNRLPLMALEPCINSTAVKKYCYNVWNMNTRRFLLFSNFLLNKEVTSG